VPRSGCSRPPRLPGDGDLMLPAIEDLLRGARGARREVIEVLEPKPARGLVASRDILRRDELGRTVVAVPKGQPPAHWVELTPVERSQLVEPPPPVPAGFLHAGAGGFTPEGIVTGGWILDGLPE